MADNLCGYGGMKQVRSGNTALNRWLLAGWKLFMFCQGLRSDPYRYCNEREMAILSIRQILYSYLRTWSFTRNES
jgi:hypothetical protein